MSSERRPEIFLLSLAYKTFFDNTYATLIDGLNKSAQLKRAKSSNGAIRYLEANNPNAILVTDEGLTVMEYRAVVEKLLAYVRNGGLVIIGFHFPNFAILDAIDKFFNEGLELPWQSGDYHRTTFQFNPSCSLPSGIMKDAFPTAYSMKVLHVKNARPHEKIFSPIPEAMTQSFIFPPSGVDEAQAAIVGANIGHGFLVYCGDVNGEESSDKVILAFCGL